MLHFFRHFFGAVLLLISFAPLTLRAQETRAALKDGYYLIKNARTAENALYIGRPRIPKNLPGAAFNKDPMRACWTFDEAWPLPKVFEYDDLYFLFKLKRVSDDGLFTIQNVGSDRYLACTEREGATLPTIPFVFDDAFFYIERADGDRNYVNIVSFKLIDKPRNAACATEHDNGVVMGDVGEAGAKWLLIPVADRNVHLE